MITIDILKAKEVWKDKIRQARKTILEQLDVDYMKAQEDADTPAQQAIVTVKQTLRDLPSQVDTANSIEEIKAVWNNMLGDK